VPRPSLQLVAPLFVAAVFAHPDRLEAQCADGSPPPCIAPRVASRETSRPIDRNRIAILPFRVTTSDSLLGEGFAELLATEFTGEGTPRSVDMGGAIQAWRRAGGGSRNPLSREQAIQVARQLGAGIVSEGSIIGLGRQITISATLFTVPDGKPEGTTARVTASVDSLDVALRKTATLLIAGLGGRIRDEDATRYTDSPEAMRLYLQGMKSWRRGLLNEASRDFERAIEKDSLFARALFRRYIAASWGAPGISVSLARIWNVRDRLSRHEQIVVQGIAGSEYPKARLIQQRFADRDRAVERLPDAPDALYAAGDFWYHMGSGVDPERSLLIARDYLEGAASADSQATFLVHLIEIGLHLRDTALLKRVTPAYLRTDSPGRWFAAWEAAASTGDAAMLARLRLAPDTAVSMGVGFTAAVDAPGQLLDEAIARLHATASAQSRPMVGQMTGFMYAARGRPDAAKRAWRVLTPKQSEDEDPLVVSMAIGDAGDGLDVAGAIARLRAVPATDTARAVRARCLVALYELQQNPSATVDTSQFGRYARHCKFGIDVSRIPLDSGSVTEAALARMDSTLRERITANTFPFGGYEALLLAKAWEKAGNVPRALTAIRYRQYGFGPSESVWNYRHEGRIAALAGDNAGAIKAYTHWLQIMRDAEPVWNAKRDVVRSELARLTTRTTP
jgi:tetratricopeptide (TPR) repeat protein